MNKENKRLDRLDALPLDNMRMAGVKLVMRNFLTKRQHSKPSEREWSFATLK